MSVKEPNTTCKTVDDADNSADDRHRADRLCACFEMMCLEGPIHWMRSGGLEVRGGGPCLCSDFQIEIAVLGITRDL